MNFENMSIEELDALTLELCKAKNKKLKEAENEFRKNLIHFLNQADHNWELFVIYLSDDGLYTVDDLIQKLKAFPDDNNYNDNDFWNDEEDEPEDEED